MFQYKIIVTYETIPNVNSRAGELMKIFDLNRYKVISNRYLFDLTQVYKRKIVNLVGTSFNINTTTIKTIL